MKKLDVLLFRHTLFTLMLWGGLARAASAQGVPQSNHQDTTVSNESRTTDWHTLLPNTLLAYGLSAANRVLPNQRVCTIFLRTYFSEQRSGIVLAGSQFFTNELSEAPYSYSSQWLSPS